MMIHLFAFRWKSSASQSDKDRAISDIRAFEGAIPGLLEVHVGTNISSRGGGYETGGAMKFADEDALQAYNSHPLHQALLSWLIPLIEPIEVDFSSN